MNTFYLVQIGPIAKTASVIGSPEEKQQYAKQIQECNDFIHSASGKVGLEQPIIYAASKIITFSMDEQYEDVLKTLAPHVVKDFQKSGSEAYGKILDSIGFEIKIATNTYKPRTPAVPVGNIEPIKPVQVVAAKPAPSKPMKRKR